MMLSLRKSNQIGLLHRQMNTLSCRDENLSFFTSTVTMETNNISCIGTFLSQYIYLKLNVLHGPILCCGL